MLYKLARGGVMIHHRYAIPAKRIEYSHIQLNQRTIFP
jgi:hypothetical protein